MWQIKESLHGAFEKMISHLIEQESKNNGQGEEEDQIIKVNNERISKDAPKDRLL
jgi:hypothetical protein